MRFNPNGLDAFAFGVGSHSVEQHGFAGPARIDQHRTFGGASDACARKRDANAFSHFGTAGYLRWRRAGTGGEGVADFVPIAVIASLRNLCSKDSFSNNYRN
jgi:hypothetical protein